MLDAGQNMNWPPPLPRNFKLTITSRGYYARIKGRTRWICGKRSPDEALRIYHRKAAALTGDVQPLPEPRPVTGQVTIHWLLNRWLIDRRSDAQRGELSPATFADYRRSAKRIDPIAGHYVADEITPDHVKSIYDQLAQRHNVDFAKRAISHFCNACRHAADSGWCRPVRIGTRVVAKLTARSPARMKWKLYTPVQVRQIIAAADAAIAEGDGRVQPSMLQLRAMILLALNGGYGAKELSDLPREVVDLDHARIDHDRFKTGVRHIVPLWPESVAALKPVLELRPDDDLLFRTREGNPWCWTRPVLDGGKLVRKIANDNVNQRFTELVKPLGLKIARQGFYKLRHLSQTTADAAGDPHATFILFGHQLPGAKGHYVAVGEDRLRKVVEYVRQRLILNQQSDPLPSVLAG